MKILASITLISFYLFGTLLLPLGDFTLVKDLPAMFEHCKTTEDKDLNVFEFLTEHVSGIGQLIESTEHESDEEEDGDKPHAPVQFHFEQQHIICTNQQLKAPVIKPVPIPAVNPVLTDKVHISDYISKIFRPPIA